MKRGKSVATPQHDTADNGGGMLPEPPPFRPDPDLIGDMHKPDRAQHGPKVTPQGVALPEAPPMQPDLNLIGDLQWPEKSDRNRKRRWFGLRSGASARSLGEEGLPTR